jgi:methanogenic corrinoid protein MtbC1
VFEVMMNSDALEFEAALLNIDRLAACRILEQQLPERDPFVGIEQVVVPALEHIGEQWEEGRVSLAQVYMSGRICEQLVDRFLPVAAPQLIDQPQIAIAILDDYHTLGKTVIYSALRASGIDLTDFGTLDRDQLLRQVKNHNIRILLVSVLMLASALQLKDFIADLKEAGLPTKVIVGGAPFRFDSELWTRVGADAVGNNTAEAIRITRQLQEVAA